MFRPARKTASQVSGGKRRSMSNSSLGHAGGGPEAQPLPHGITAQLEEMKRSGIGGAEIVHYYRFTEKGNRRWGSPEWAEIIRHALREATRLEMKIALVFSPGWDFGSPFIPPTERSKVLAPAWLDFTGPFQYEGPLPPFKDFGTPKDGLFAHVAPVEGAPDDQGRPIAVVGARLTGKDTIDPASLVDLTDEFRGNAGRWRVEEGAWRLFSFRLQYTGQQNSAQNEEPKSWVVDHLSSTAMRRYATTCAEMFRREFGQWIPTTLESVFSDSFEAVPLANTLLWSNSTMEDFRRLAGYDLTPLLPALWFDIGERTPQVRYDVNRAMHRIALDSCFRPFLEACAMVGLQGRMQPHYRFTEEIVEGAGMAHLPETEVTTARFETVPDPRKATVSGARFYGRPLVSAEAYTFLHRERYRATLEELKRATDAQLRDGVARFYNHGWLYTEEPAADARSRHGGVRAHPALGPLVAVVQRLCRLRRPMLRHAAAGRLCGWRSALLAAGRCLEAQSDIQRGAAHHALWRHPQDTCRTRLGL